MGEHETPEKALQIMLGQSTMSVSCDCENCSGLGYVKHNMVSKRGYLTGFINYALCPNCEGGIKKYPITDYSIAN